MSSTGHDRLPYDQDRLLPTTLYAFYPVGSSPPEYTENTRLCIMTSTGHDRLLYIRSTQELGLRSTGSVSKTPTRPCFVHRPDYSFVFTYGLGLTQYSCFLSSFLILRISGYRTLAYRASHNITVLSCLRTQLNPICNTLQISNGNHTLISLRFMTITGKYSMSYMIFTSEQRRSIQVSTYIHTKGLSAS